MITKDEIKDFACEISSWLQDAAGDSAFTDDWEEIESNFNHIKGMKKMIADAKAWPVRDVKGWLADALYDDIGWCSDMTGDRIHDIGKGEYLLMIAIAEEIKIHGHNALKKAMDLHITDWQERLEKQMQKEFDQKYPDGSCIEAHI